MQQIEGRRNFIVLLSVEMKGWFIFVYTRETSRGLLLLCTSVRQEEVSLSMCTSNVKEEETFRLLTAIVYLYLSSTGSLPFEQMICFSC